MSIHFWNKKYTETLAQTLIRFRTETNIQVGEKITYAGRLDPMAEGLLVLLTGDDVHKKDSYMGLDKVYEIDFMLGPRTDTYDILGLVSLDSQIFSVLDDKKLAIFIKESLGSFEQPYPPYSSKPVEGKPLFMWARENRLSEIVIPTKKVSIYSIEYKGKKIVSLEDFKNEIITNMRLVEGDFRQDEITDSWKKYLEKQVTKEIEIYTISVSASSGTYMRSLVEALGASLVTGACTLKIKRVSIGDYKL